MPVGKYQSKTMQYATITFVALFVIAATAGVVFYLKAEEYRTKMITAQGQIEELATSAELQNIGSLVGESQLHKSRLGSILDYLDKVTYLVIGGVAEETSAQVKAETVQRQGQELIGALSRYLDLQVEDVNTIGLIRLAGKVKTKLEEMTVTLEDLQQQHDKLQGRFTDAMASGTEKEKTLLAEKEKYQQEVNDIKKDYAALKVLLEQSADQQVKTLDDQLRAEKDNSKILNQELLKTQAELTIAEDRIKNIQDKLQKLVPPPDMEIAAFKPDGQIILIDPHTKVVHLDIGRKDGVYQGLTFSVYEKNMPIPKNGKGKAEIEVFNVGESISAARIIRSEISRPIVLDDTIANLIWDSDKKNIFVVAGDFDLDDDGSIDYDGENKIAGLIEKWNGVAEDSISVGTDFVVLGSQPEIPRKPTFEQLETDPMAMDKYEAALERLSRYKQVLKQANRFSIPIFNTERFLYFIGYKTQTTRPGAF
jgi:hypothetical protein